MRRKNFVFLFITADESLQLVFIQRSVRLLTNISQPNSTTHAIPNRIYLHSTHSIITFLIPSRICDNIPPRESSCLQEDWKEGNWASFPSGILSRQLRPLDQPLENLLSISKNHCCLQHFLGSITTPSSWKLGRF